MHAAELVELAALLAANSAPLLTADVRLAPRNLEEYWTASKCRLDRWYRTLHDFRTQMEEARQRPSAAQWKRLRPVAEEILSGEVLARVWGAMVAAADRIAGIDAGESIARSVHVGHMEARNRALSLVLSGRGIEPSQALVLNRLRRRAERWTDLLVGYVAQHHPVSGFAPDPERALDFADDLRRQRDSEGGRHAWPLTLAALRAGIGKGFAAVSPNADLNTRIAGSILAALPQGAFDGVGLMQSLWMVRLSTAVADTEGMVADLLREETDRLDWSARRQV
jgi:hypothetical protein